MGNRVYRKTVYHYNGQTFAPVFGHTKSSVHPFRANLFPSNHELLSLHCCKSLSTMVPPTTAKSSVPHQPTDSRSRRATLSLHLNQLEAFCDNPPMLAAVLDGQNLWPLFPDLSIPLLVQYPIATTNPASSDYNRRSEEHTSELQSRENLVCRLLLE